MVYNKSAVSKECMNCYEEEHTQANARARVYVCHWFCHGFGRCEGLGEDPIEEEKLFT